MLSWYGAPNRQKINSESSLFSAGLGSSRFRKTYKPYWSWKVHRWSVGASTKPATFVFGPKETTSGLLFNIFIHIWMQGVLSLLLTLNLGCFRLPGWQHCVTRSSSKFSKREMLGAAPGMQQWWVAGEQLGRKGAGGAAGSRLNTLYNSLIALYNFPSRGSARGRCWSPLPAYWWQDAG